MTEEQRQRIEKLLVVIEGDDWLDEWLDRQEFELQLDLIEDLQCQYGETRDPDDWLAWQTESLRLDEMIEGRDHDRELHGTSSGSGLRRHELRNASQAPPASA
jgi:hypothetical protein